MTEPRTDTELYEAIELALDSDWSTTGDLDEVIEDARVALHELADRLTETQAREQHLRAGQRAAIRRRQARS